MRKLHARIRLILRTSLDYIEEVHQYVVKYIFFLIMKQKPFSNWGNYESTNKDIDY